MQDTRIAVVQLQSRVGEAAANIARIDRFAAEEKMVVVADLKAADLEEVRRVPEMFFRHFRRPEMYAKWEREP